MKSITLEHVVMACILGMFIRDMVIEFKPKQNEEGVREMNLNENPELLEREKELDQLHEQMTVYSARIDWLEKGLKLVIKIANDRESGLVMTAQAILDGEPTTADQYNNVQEEKDIKNDLYGTEKYVRISDVNKEIAEE